MSEQSSPSAETLQDSLGNVAEQPTSKDELFAKALSFLQTADRGKTEAPREQAVITPEGAVLFVAESLQRAKRERPHPPGDGFGGLEAQGFSTLGIDPERDQHDEEYRIQYNALFNQMLQNAYRTGNAFNNGEGTSSAQQETGQRERKAGGTVGFEAFSDPDEKEVVLFASDFILEGRRVGKTDKAIYREAAFLANEIRHSKDQKPSLDPDMLDKVFRTAYDKQQEKFLV